MSAENPFSRPPVREMSPEDLGLPKEESATPAAENAPEVMSGNPERIEAIGKQMESLRATGSRSAEKLRTIKLEANRHPEYFGGNEELTQQFWARVQEKADELKTAPELLQKKEEFWKKWKTGSVVTASVGILGGMAGAAWAQQYGFDHTYMKEVLEQSVNVPAVAGFLTAAAGLGSAGIAKVMEMIRSQKGDDLERSLRANKI